jgi:hypothetical protein
MAGVHYPLTKCKEDVMTEVNDNSELRKQALKRIKEKRDVGAHFLAFVLVNALLVAVWAMTDVGFFWPIFPIVGWGIGIVFHAWDAFARPPSEERIRREMERLDRR